MNQVMRNDAVKFLPALGNLIQYKIHFNDIAHFLEVSTTNKLKEMEESQKSIDKFLNSWERVVGNYFEAINSQKPLQIEKNISQIAEPEPKFDQTKSKISSKLMKYEKKSSSTLPHSIIFKDENLRISAMMKQHRVADMVKFFSQKLERNISTCQLFTNLLNLERNKKYKQKIKNNKYCICLYCDFSLRNQYQSRKSSDIVSEHFNSCHPDIQYHRRGSVNSYSVFEAYEKLSKQVDALGNKYYKCNCQTRPCQTPQQYIDHMQNTHSNQVPLYSSHIYSSKGHLITNQNFNQLCVLEDMVTHETYYCGQCDIGFQRRADVFYSHIFHYHNGSTNHPLTSHHLKLNQNIKWEKHRPILAETKKLARPPKINSFQNTQTAQFSLDQNQSTFQFPLDFTDLQSKALEKASINSASLKKRRKEKGKKKNTKNEETSPFKCTIFPEEQKFIQMIQNFKGPYICSVCDKNFQTHNGIVRHFESFQTKNTHLKKQKNWMRVKIRKIKQSQSCCYYLPFAEEYMNIQLKVPYLSNNLIKYEQMDYREFLNFAVMKNKYYNSYSWFHYSECQDQDQENNEGNQENDSNTDDLQDEQKKGFKNHERTMLMDMNE